MNLADVKFGIETNQLTQMSYANTLKFAKFKALTAPDSLNSQKIEFHHQIWYGMTFSVIVFEAHQLEPLFVSYE